MKKVCNYIQWLFLSVTISIIADDPLKSYSTKNNDFYNCFLQAHFETNGKDSNFTPGDIVLDRIGTVSLSVCARVFDAIKLKKNQSSGMNGADSQINRSQDNSLQLSIDTTGVTLSSINFSKDHPLIVEQEHQSSGLCDQLIQNSSEANILGSIPLVVLTNPVGVAAVVTVVATVLVVDRLAQMGLIDSGWSLAHLKENIFGVKIYEGDEYYKNWSNPRNLERQFPAFFAYEGALPQRSAYERQMSFHLVSAQNMLDKQESLKKLQWPHKVCDKLLNFTLTADPIYISENEEIQLDARLTQELANCRDSAIRSMKKNIADLYNVFESLGNELIHQLKSSVQDLLNFKIDSKFIVLLGAVALDRFQTDDFYDELSECNSVMQESKSDDCLSEMNKKSVVKLFTNGSEYHKLLENFEHSLDVTDQFFQEYSSKVPRFTIDQNNDIAKISVESIVDFVKDKVVDKKESIQACLQKIEEHYKKSYQAKNIQNLTKFLKKSSANRLAHRNKKIEQRLLLHEPVSIDMQDLLSFDRLNIFKNQDVSLSLRQEIKDFIDDCLQGRYDADKKMVSQTGRFYMISPIEKR